MPEEFGPNFQVNMFPSLVEIRSVTSEIRRQKEDKTHSGKIKAFRHRDAVRSKNGPRISSTYGAPRNAGSVP